jgi:long-chain acyl-CoA synthetase
VTDVVAHDARSAADGVLADDAAGRNGRSVPALLLARAAATPTHVALRKRDLGRWKEYSWAEYATRAANVGLALRSLGVKPGDRVAVLCGNRPAWLFADLGTQGIGAVTVGVYPTSPAAEVEYLLAHSGAVVVVCEDEEQTDKVLEVRARCPELRHTVVVDTKGLSGVDDDRSLMSFHALEALGAEEDAAGYRAAVDALELDSPAIIVYTSGTTGPPKGAMLSHRNLLTAAESGQQVFEVTPRDEVLSYLPLCHIAERLLSVIDPVATGYIVNFGGGIDDLATDLTEVQPTFFLGVPRVWEKMLAGVEIRMADASLLKRLVYRHWTKVGAKLARRRMEGRFGPLGRLRYTLGWVLLYRPLRDKLGLRRIRIALSGAAPIAPAVLEYFWALGIPVFEAYGQTENTAQATGSRPGVMKLGTVGKVVPLAEVKIGEHGEILTRGPGTFLGYYRDEAATKVTFTEEGWLRTGDVGELDEAGFLTITDRMKDLIITAGGKNISPSEIENRLKVSPYVREAVVIGDRRPYLTALIGIEEDTVGNWCTRNRMPYTTYEDLSSNESVRELIGEVVAEVNHDLAQVETIKQFRLLPKVLDQDDGEVTATQKVKRRAIADLFSNLIEEMYR